MRANFFLPTKILMDDDCVRKNAALFGALGKKALIVTGKNSARATGALQDVTDALTSQKIEYTLFDKVRSNPDIATVREGAKAARESGSDFIIGIGGGSPMDAAKAVALLSRQELTDEALFGGGYSPDVLPFVLIPTTAGTGSEATQYSVLTNDKAQTKTSIATPYLFASIAMVDAKYTSQLPLITTVNTALDALSHCVEGMLSVRASALTDALAADGIARFAAHSKELVSGKIDAACRADLMYASTIGGIVIAHTSVTAPHAMGYPLTYYRHIDHGRANALLMAAFLAFEQKGHPEIVARILGLLSCKTTAEFKELVDALLGEKEKFEESDLAAYAASTATAKSVSNSVCIPTEQDVYRIYCESFA